jgi:hypothetical protein
MPISLPKEINQPHIINYPIAIDEFWLEAFVSSLVNIFSRFEVFHLSTLLNQI